MDDDSRAQYYADRQRKTDELMEWVYINRYAIVITIFLGFLSQFLPWLPWNK